MNTKRPQLVQAHWISVNDVEYLPCYLTENYQRLNQTLTLRSDHLKDGLVTPKFILKCREVLLATQDEDTLKVDGIGTIRLLKELPFDLSIALYECFCTATRYSNDSPYVVCDFCAGKLHKMIWNWFAGLPPLFWQDFEHTKPIIELEPEMSVRKIAQELKLLCSDWRETERFLHQKSREQSDSSVDSYYQGREIAMAYCQGQLYRLIDALNASLPEVYEHE